MVPPVVMVPETICSCRAERYGDIEPMQLFEEQTTSAEQELLETQISLKIAEGNLETVQNALQQEHHENNRLRERRAKLRKANAKLLETNVKHESDIHILNTKNATLQSEYEELQKTNSVLQSNLELLQDVLPEEHLKPEMVQDIRTKRNMLQKENASLLEANATYESEVQSLNLKNSTLQKEFVELQQSYTSLQEEHASFRALYNSLREVQNTLLSCNGEIEAENMLLREEMKRFQGDCKESVIHRVSLPLSNEEEFKQPPNDFNQTGKSLQTQIQHLKDENIAKQDELIRNKILIGVLRDSNGVLRTENKKLNDEMKEGRLKLQAFEMDWDIALEKIQFQVDRERQAETEFYENLADEMCDVQAQADRIADLNVGLDDELMQSTFYREKEKENYDKTLTKMQSQIKQMSQERDDAVQRTEAMERNMQKCMETESLRIKEEMDSTIETYKTNLDNIQLKIKQSNQERDDAVQRMEAMERHLECWMEAESLRIKEEQVNGYDDDLQQLLLQAVAMNNNKKRRHNC